MSLSPNLGYIASSAVLAEWFADGAQPRVTIQDRLCIPVAQVRRIFPLSDPDRYWCIQDAAGEEICIVDDLSGLSAATRRVLEETLDRRYFTPEITRITELDQEAGMWRFAVETNRGPTEFFVRNWRDSAHEISLNRWQIYSVDGGRFDIPNLEALDESSRRHMARLL